MDSTGITAALGRALAATFLAMSAGAFAANHEVVAASVRPGPFAVACSNVEHDTAKLAALGGTAPDYWEGREVNGTARYVTDVLAQPATAIVFRANVPLRFSLYPTRFGSRVEFAAVVCHPTTRANSDPAYALPDNGGTVPHMQPAGAAPRGITNVEYAQTLGLAPPSGPAATQRLPLIVYSHGLGGSPLGKGYIDVMVQLAAQGYAVAAVFHADARFSKIRIEDVADVAYALAFFPLIVEMQAMRPVALKALADTVLAHPGFAPLVDPERIGGFGASMGGQAMAHLLGARITSSLAKGCDDPVHDPRVKVAFGYVPYAGQSFLPAFCDGQSGAADVDRPYFAMSGTADTTAPLGLMQQAMNRFRGSRYLVELVGGQHELRPEDAGDVLSWMVTFYDAYLNRSPEAMARLIRMRQVAGGAEDNLVLDVHVPFAPAASEIRTREFYQADGDRYHQAIGEAQVAAFASQAGFEDSAHGFKGLDNAVFSPPFPPLCRFADPGGVVRLAPGNYECEFMRRAIGGWSLLDIPMGIILPIDGACPPGHLQVRRAVAPEVGRFKGTDRRQRYTTSDSTLRDMVRLGWFDSGVVACSLP